MDNDRNRACNMLHVWDTSFSFKPGRGLHVMCIELFDGCLPQEHRCILEVGHLQHGPPALMVAIQVPVHLQSEEDMSINQPCLHQLHKRPGRQSPHPAGMASWTQSHSPTLNRRRRRAAVAGS